jgi:glucosamine 6-phosphate synthetase-like amidotransferase/phosphosugar isomerase protein
LAGLKTLEYRGYDSAGIYIPRLVKGVSDGIIFKSVGNVDRLQ